MYVGVEEGKLVVLKHERSWILLLFKVLLHATVVELGHCCVTYLYACSATEQEIKQKICDTMTIECMVHIIK